MTIYNQNVYLVAGVNYLKICADVFTMPEQHFCSVLHIYLPPKTLTPPPPPYIGGWVGVCVWFDV